MRLTAKVATAAVVGLSLRVSAQSLSRTCFGSNICYSLNIPESTAQSGNGDIFFQISAPSSYQWVALGQGSQMSGSNIFVVYASADGQNVTVSPRLGLGHIEPLYDTDAQISVLSGSGVNNGTMTANVKCSNCHSWSGGNMDFTSQDAEWLHAYKFGNPLNSDELDQQISQHDDAGPFLWDFTSAKGGDDVNPFISSTATASTANQTALPFNGNTQLGTNVATVHGVFACLAFVALFPTGGILIRLASFPGAVWVHAAIQSVGWVFWLIAFSLGLYLACELQAFHNAHPIVGVLILILLLTQPLTGLIHHRMFAIYNRRTPWSYAHVGLGRFAVVLGLINGGHGLRFAGASLGQFVAYAIPATIMGLAYVGTIIADITKRRRKAPVTNEYNLREHVRPIESRDTDTDVVHVEEHFNHKAQDF